MRIVAVCFSVALVAVLACSCACGERQPRETELQWEGAGGFQLTGTLYLPEALGPPGVLLVHGYGANRDVWAGTARLLRDLGFMALAFDLPGHGDSTQRNGASVHYRQLDAGVWQAVAADLGAAKNAMVRAGAHPEHLAVMGEGLGANLSLRLAVADPAVQAVVLISPGLELQGIASEADMHALTDCPSLIIAAEGDAYAAMSASALKAAAPVFSELRLWPGAAHGTGIFAAHPDAVHYVVQWLIPIIRPGQ